MAATGQMNMKQNESMAKQKLRALEAADLADKQGDW